MKMEATKSPTIQSTMKNLANLIVLFLAAGFYTKLNAQEGALNFTHYSKQHTDGNKLRYTLRADGSLAMGPYSIPVTEKTFEKSTAESFGTDLIKAYESQVVKDEEAAALAVKLEGVDPAKLDKFLASQKS